jgi:hypothetical protein
MVRFKPDAQSVHACLTFSKWQFPWSRDWKRLPGTAQSAKKSSVAERTLTRTFKPAAARPEAEGPKAKAPEAERMIFHEED